MQPEVPLNQAMQHGLLESIKPATSFQKILLAHDLLCTIEVYLSYALVTRDMLSDCWNMPIR